MQVNAIPYRVTPDGYIDHWLVAGPADQDWMPEGGSLDNCSSSTHPEPSYLETFTRPVEWEPPLQVGSDSHRWMYRRSLADHRLDLADTHSEPVLRRYWLYAEVLPGHQSELALVVEAAGKVFLWANGREVEAECLEGGGSAERLRFALPRHEGTLRLFLELRAFVCGAWSGFLSACLDPHVGSARINLPTAVNPERRLGLEAVIGDFALDRHVFSRTDPITLRWPADYDRTAILGINLRRPGGATYVEVMQAEVKAGTEHALNMDFTGPDGRFRLTVKPHLQEYYEENQRVECVQDVYVIDHVFEQTPEQEDEDRVQRLLQAAFRHQEHFYRELAVLQRPGEEPDRRLLEDCIRIFSEGSADAEMGFLALWQMGRDLEAGGDQESLAILDGSWSRYLPSTAIDGVENNPVRGFLACVCQVLAGLQDPLAMFVGFGGRLGSDLVREGASLAQAWMLNRLARGFGGCESEVEQSLILLGCSCLAEGCGDEDLANLSLMLMDRVLFGVACGSYRGVYGLASTGADTDSVLDARLGALAPVAYGAWGLGTANGHIQTPVALARSDYEAPVVVRELGLFVPDAVWSRERYARVGEPDTEDTGDEEVHRVAWRTADGMLSCLPDYRVGEQGHRELVWQAVLGVAAKVHVNGPASMSTNDAVPRNFWRGNARLPRVVQWQDVLMAFYRGVDAGQLGFTHAHFPVHAFAETDIREHWAFGRHGTGWLGLYAANGLELITSGPGAGRELHSPGADNTWLCLMGGEGSGEDFEAFRERLTSTLAVASDVVSIANTEGQTVSCGLAVPLTVDGKPMDLAGSLHLDSPFCRAPYPASALTIQGPGTSSLELAFG
ncbi:MAG: hypothetical protein F4Z18_11260 [Caldilineaceae bacterium SB0666_bin_21]|nr:hypothetical protein [Caldilineaceae bacterium SB0666_bin_21]